MKSNTTDEPDGSIPPRGPSQLFLLRVWLDDEPGENDWQGRVQHPVTGEAHSFRTCAELRRLIREMIGPAKSDQFSQKPESQNKYCDLL